MIKLPVLCLYDIEEYAKKHGLERREFENFLITVITESAKNVEREIRSRIRDEENY
jgi:hypothetical protein